MKRKKKYESIMSDSHITIIGRNELWIENYKALLTYDEDKILVQAKEYMVCIEGTKLIINHYMEAHMMIRGNIRKITYS